VGGVLIVVSSNSISLVEISNSTTCGGGPTVSRGDLLNLVTDCCKLLELILPIFPLLPSLLTVVRNTRNGAFKTCKRAVRDNVLS
jgi:hypothetical protein